MTKRMLVDATHPEETRVAIVKSYRDHNRLEDLDFGLASKPVLRGNIYLAKVMRIEPSLQAAFVEYGGNRHGFLPFSEIHPDYFRIPMADRDDEEEIIEGEAEEVEAEEAETEEASQEETAETSEEENTEEASEEKAQAETKGEEQSPLKSYSSDEDEDDDDVGLITDFGNAAIDDSSLTEVDMPETPPEDVGGEVTERIVRNHRPRYKIQEVLKRGQVMLIQVVKEERGNKGAALTSFLSLAGRYCVLMPNTDHGGGVSRKITNHQDRRRMKEILDQLETPEGMAVILRTAGMEQTPPDIQRDLEYLLRLWDNIREQTLQSSAPAMIYEEANLIKRSVRDLYRQDIDEILVAGKDGYEKAHDFMEALMPDQAQKLKYYEDAIPLFIRYQVENQIDTLHTPIAQLRSGGYLVINPTEALVSIDVNSGRATRERHIEETALKTNLEAADEVARQLRLRDLAGLVVIDFIDMEDGRNNAAVERRMKEVMKNDRARLQIGRISPFGLMELSRQRMRPSLIETNFEKCPHCSGMGVVRSPDSAALSVLRAIEEEAIKGKVQEIKVTVPTHVALYILNQKRRIISRLESTYNIDVDVDTDDLTPPPGYKLERIKGNGNRRHNNGNSPAVNSDKIFAQAEREMAAQDNSEQDDEDENATQKPRRRRRPRRNNKNRRRRTRKNETQQDGENTDNASSENQPTNGKEAEATDNKNDENAPRRRRRGRRGGRRRNNNDNRRRNNKNGNGEPSNGENVNTAPRSVHEIDTTPKPMSQDKPSQQTTAPRSYENVNPPTDGAPKSGWWRRITGQ